MELNGHRTYSRDIYFQDVFEDIFPPLMLATKKCQEIADLSLSKCTQ
jgi:hypothetical protein